MINLNEQIKKSSIRNNKIVNSFITSEKTNNHISFKNLPTKDLIHNEKRKFQKAGINRLLKQKSSEISNTENDDNLNDELKPDNYEDLFFFFLLHIGKIEYFENILINKKERRTSNTYFFMNIYDSLTEEKIFWNNFFFPKYVFKLFYIKSRKLQKDIIKYSILKGKEIMEVINSYNKKYTSNIKLKNWSLKPSDAYLNYEKINQSKNSELENSNKKTLSKIANFTDFIIRTKNKGKGKTLIFLGKTINIYIDDIENYQNKKNELSMATEDSEFKKNTKNEIIYTFDDIAHKNKKKNLTINNINTKLNNSKNLNLDLSNNKYKKIPKKMIHTTKNKFKFRNRIININKKEIEKNLFFDYRKNIHKLPIIQLSKKHSPEHSELKEFKNRTKEISFMEKMKNKYISKKNENKKNKIRFNSFRIFNNENKIKDNKTIINFFTKKNKDFYY